MINFDRVGPLPYDYFTLFNFTKKTTLATPFTDLILVDICMDWNRYPPLPHQHFVCLLSSPLSMDKFLKFVCNWNCLIWISIKKETYRPLAPLETFTLRHLI